MYIHTYLYFYIEIHIYIYMYSYTYTCKRTIISPLYYVAKSRRYWTANLLWDLCLYVPGLTWAYGLGHGASGLGFRMECRVRILETSGSLQGSSR